MSGAPDAAPARFRFSTIAHADRSVLGPLSSGSVDALLARLSRVPAAPTARPAVLDVGCGKGEILVRAMRRLDATGVGVDPNLAFLSTARERARAAGVANDLVLHACEGAGAPLADVRFELVICTGAAHAFGGLAAALAALTALTAPGGRALVGHGYWRREPAAAYLAAFGGDAGELAALTPTLAVAERAGWTVLAHHESTTAEWDEYEHGYAAAMRAWLAANPADPDAPAFRGRIETWAGAYERWGRSTMGFTTALLRRTD